MNGTNRTEPGRWTAYYDENGSCTGVVYDATFRRLVGYAPEKAYHNSQDTWVDLIHPDDAQRVLEHTKQCARTRVDGMNYDIEYRLRTVRGYRWVHDIGNILRREDGSVYQCDGVVFDIQDSIDLDKAYSALTDNNQRLLALHTNFTTLYDIELDTGHFERYTSRYMVPDAIYQTMDNREDFFANVPVNIPLVVHPEDKDRMLRVLTREHIQNALSVAAQFDETFRLVTQNGFTWMRMRFAYRDEDGRRIIIGMFDVTEEMTEKAREEKRRAEIERTNRSMFALEDNLEALYDVNLQTEEYVYTAKGTFFVENAPKTLINTNRFFSDLRTNLPLTVHPDDMPQFDTLLSAEKVRQALSDSKHWDVYYRALTQDCILWLKIRLVYKDETKQNVIVGVFNATEEMAAREAEEKQRIETENTNRRLFALQDDLNALHELDLDSGRYTIYTKDRLSSEVTVIQTVYTDTFFDDIRSKFEGMIHPDDAAALSSRIQMSEILRALNERGHAEYYYRFKTDDGYVWLKSRAVFKDKSKKTILLGIYEAREEMAAREEEQARLCDTQTRLSHEHLIGEIMQSLLDQIGDPIEIIAQFAEPLRALFGADQFVYKDAEGEHADADNFPEHRSYPTEYCAECAFHDPANSVYKDGFVEIPDCHNTSQYPTAHERCPIQSVLAHAIYVDGITAGYITFNYFRKAHRFTQPERGTIRLIANAFSSALSRYKAQQENRVLREMQEMQRRLNNQRALLDYFVESYASCYAISLSDTSIEVLRRESDDDDLFAHGGKQTIRQFIDQYVHPDDRALLRQITSKDYIAERLRREKSFTFVMREKKAGKYRTMRGLIARVSDEYHLVAGFMDITNDIERERQQLERIEQSSHIINTLSSDFVEIDYLTLEEDNSRYRTFNYRSSPLLERLLPGWSAEPDFSKRMHRLHDTLLCAQDREHLAQELRRENILSRLRSEGAFSVNLRLLIDGAPQYWQMHISTMAVDDMSRLVAGLRSIDEQMRKELENQQRLRALLAQTQQTANALAEQSAFTSFFLEPYASAYYVDLDTHTYTVYKRPACFEKMFPSELDIFVAFKSFIDSYVHPDDRETVYDFCNLENTRRHLAAHKAIHMTYREIWGGETNYIRVQIIRGADENHAVFGFMDVTQEYRKERETQEQLRASLEKARRANEQIAEQNAFNSYFLNSYAAVYYISLIDCSFKVYHFTDASQKEYPVFNTYLEAVDKYLLENVHPEDSDTLYKLTRPEYIRSELAKKKEFSYIYRFLNNLGEFRFRLQIIRGADEDHAVFGIMDITEDTRRQQREFEKTQALNHTLSMLATDFVEVDYIQPDFENNRYPFANYRSGALFERLLPGWEKETDFAVKLQRLYDHLLYKEDHDTVGDALAKNVLLAHKESGDIYTVNMRLMIDGSLQYWQIQFSASRSENRYGVVVGIRSIDEQMRRELGNQQKLRASLRESQEAVAKIAEQSAFTSYFLAPYLSAYYVGLDDLSLEVYKRTQELEQKYPAETFADYIQSIDAYIDTEVHPDDREMLRDLTRPRNMKRRLAESAEFNCVFRTVENGQVRHMRFQVIRGADGSHAAFGFADITQEVTRQQKQEKELQEALAMAQSANRAKTTFLNNMSHDIRTPMNAIMGYTALAEHHIDSRERVKDYLEKISQSSAHLLSLINDVLDMSRIESGKMSLSEKPERLSAIIHTLRDIVQSDIHSKQLDFFVDAMNIHSESILCDKLRLNQVLLNILSNSIKYTAAGGTVTMCVTEKGRTNDGRVQFAFVISDNGMGMDKEFLKTIYDPFTRVKSSTVSGIQGTGLGMAITKNIVDMMGGTIHIESEPGKGTTTTVTFAFKPQSQSTQDTPIPELLNRRALIVDDNATTCLSVCSMIRDTGMRYEWCTSGKEALIRAEAAEAEGCPFHVYIIDWILPDMNGIETARRLRKAVGNEALLLMLTAYDWSDVEDEAQEVGISAFVSKPMFPSDLRKALQSLWDKKTAPAAAVPNENAFFGKKVLLVEDNELNREIAADILQENGFVLDVAEDGDIAVEKICRAKPGDYDIVLMDIQMPRMNGYDATRAIRALGTEISSIPILAMTANAFEEDRRMAFEAGMNEHIAKPIDIGHLKEVLRRFL